MTISIAWKWRRVMGEKALCFSPTVLEWSTDN